MEWPANSPDLNPIEHLWDELGRAVRRRVTDQTILALRSPQAPGGGVGCYPTTASEDIGEQYEEVSGCYQRLWCLFVFVCCHSVVILHLFFA